MTLSKFSSPSPRLWCGLVLTFITLLLLMGSASAQFVAPDHVSITLNGCRNDGSITLPNGSGKFICPDSAYTSGNLGKGWNELDLVPHRLITSRGANSSTATYNVIVAADYLLNSKLGYDVILSDVGVSGPGINESHTGDGSCSATWGPQTIGPGITGGADSTIYRIVRITQNPNTTCYIDYYERLALGAHLYSGSSLQSYKFETADFTGGKATVPLPVNQILPQSLAKSMTATQGATNVWTIGKSVPASLTFPNVCDPNQALPGPVTINVSWTKTTSPGGIVITTTITATNPASRTITVNVSDQIYLGALNDTSNPIDSLSSGPVNVPANTTTTVLTHTFTDNVNTSATQYWDEATATYTDLITGVSVPGDTTATASATVTAAGGTNSSARITDQEDITPNGSSAFQFSLDSQSGTGGFSAGTACLEANYVTGPPPSCTGYTIGGNVLVDGLDWLSGTISSAGTATFKKTVHYGGSGPATGTLSDVATLTASDGFTVQSQTESTAVAAEALVNLTINKSITPTSTVAFTFHVYDATNTEVFDPATGKPPVIAFTSGGNTNGFVTLTGLQPGTYTVTEDSVTGWAETDTNSHTAVLTGDSAATCSTSVSFVNAQPDAKITLSPLTATNPIGQAHTITATVSQDDKIAAGAPGDNATGFGPAPDGTTVTFSLLNNTAGATFVNNVSTCTTTAGTCSVQINTNSPGSVDIHATTTFSVDGISLTRATGDGLSGDSANANKVYVASILRIKKVTVPSGDTTLFTFTPTSWNSGSTFQLSDGQTKSSGNLAPGTYSAAETVPNTFVLTNTACVLTGTNTAHAFTAITNGVSVVLAANEDVTCTFTNSRLPTLVVKKTIKGNSATFNFTVSGTPTNPPNTNIGLTPSANGSAQSASQIIQLGTYVINEVNIPAGWLLTDVSCTSNPQSSVFTFTASATGGTFTAGYGDNILCAFVDNQSPGATRTQGFWATHTVLANDIWNGTSLPSGTGTIPAVPVVGTADQYLCTLTPITAIATFPPNPGANQMLGGFWAGISKTSTNQTRSNLDQARMQLLQQYFAAVLNVHAFGTPIPGTTLATARAAYCGNNVNAIKAQAGLLGLYNTSGDSATFTPGASATSQLSKQEANVPFWDVTLH